MITKCKRQKKAMKTPLFTIIVPVYNAQNYIQHCMDSILGEDLKTTYDTCCAPFLYLAKNYEVIVVDDGSTDNTGVLLDNIIKMKCMLYIQKIMVCHMQEIKRYSKRKEHIFYF